MKKIKSLVQRISWLYYICSLIRRNLARLWMLLNWLFPIDPKLVVIVSYFGGGFGDNGKAVALKLLEKCPEMKIYWAVSAENEKSIPEKIHVVRYRSLKYYRLMARAGIWIDNSRKSRDVIKRKGQFYMQTWHGMLGIKRVEKDAENNLAANYIKEAKDDSRMADVFLSNGKFFTELVRRAFWYEGEILESGTPRVDELFNSDEARKKEIKKRAGLPTEKNFVLYAPTFRVNGNLRYYDLDYARLLGQLGSGWCVAVRLHPNIADMAGFLVCTEEIYNVTAYPDMYELMAAADMFITDYSSSMFEAALVKKPVFLYTADLEEYITDRNFYFDLRELPFPLAENNDSLMETIIKFDYKEYLQNLDKFWKENETFEDGRAADRAAERILQYVDSQEKK